MGGQITGLDLTAAMATAEALGAERGPDLAQALISIERGLVAAAAKQKSPSSED